MDERMNLAEIGSSLFKLLEKREIVYLTWTPDLSDFREKKPVKLHAYTKDSQIEFPIIHRTQDEFKRFVALLFTSIFATKNFVIAWDIKQLFSYLRFHLPRGFNIPISCQVIDLKLAEAFISKEYGRPLSYEEAAKRVGLLISNDDVLKINGLIYTPLSLEVLPGIETLGLINKETNRLNYSTYSIESSANGRLSSTKAFDDCFISHSMSSEDKNKFSYVGYNKRFLVFDYKHMEVSVLAWLTQDEVLNKIIDSGIDIYSVIYRLVANAKTCSAENRQFIKEIFLPVVFGMGANTLSERMKLPVKGAEALIDRINTSFKTAMSWIREKQDAVRENPIIKDKFGRTLDFSEGSGRALHSVRNAVVQSPAAIICLDKLIQLYQRKEPFVDVVASVHDAYVCIADHDSYAEHLKDILESPSTLTPGLKLKVGVKSGDTWGNLHELKI